MSASEAGLFDAPTLTADDMLRLSNLGERVFLLMRDGRFRTLSEIHRVVGGSEAGISARLREFRRPEFGGHAVERKRRGDPRRGLFEYRLILNEAL